VTRAELLLISAPGLFVLGAVLCLLFEAAGTPLGARKRGRRTHIALLALATCVAVLLQVAATWGEAAVPTTGFGGTLAFDAIGQLATAGVALLVALVIGAAVPGLRETNADHGDAYALLLLAAAGLSVLVVATDLLALAGAACLITAAFAALCALDRDAAQGAEAAVKLVQDAGLAFVVVTFGAALRYGATGGTTLCLQSPEASGLATLAAALVGVVVLGTLAATPLHMTRVDVVQGSPPFVGGFIGAAGIFGGGVLTLRWLSSCAGSLPDGFLAVLTGVAVLSLIVPPLAALDQTRVPRVAAHLVCAQAGPVLVGAIALRDGQGSGPALIAVAAGAIASVGAVVALSFLERAGHEASTWERWSGAGRLHPLFALALLWLWASLAGVPGTAGFAARVVVAQAAFAAGQDLLGLLAVVAPALAVAPVLRLAIFLFAKEPDHELTTQRSGWRAVVLGIACLLVLFLGLFPAPLLELATDASLAPLTAVAP
jgi:NADH-quinone oxidoreductase subunit N